MKNANAKLIQQASSNRGEKVSWRTCWRFRSERPRVGAASRDRHTVGRRTVFGLSVKLSRGSTILRYTGRGARGERGGKW